MNIVHVLESTATGTLAVVCMIANRMAGEGHRVRVIYSLREETPKDLRAMFHANVVLQHVQMRGVPLPLALRGLRRSVLDAQPDIVHLHSSFAGFLGRLALLGALPDTPVFYSPHCISFMRADVGGLKRRAFSLLERLACVKRATYVACSDSEAQAIEAYLKQTPALVENAADARIFEHAEAAGKRERSHERALRVITVGGIRAQKNPALFAQLAEAFKGEPVDFVWIGNGDAGLRDRLMMAGVRVTGWLPHTNAIDEVTRADIYLSTSSWEGMPVSVIEALVLGKAVLATRAPGNRDIVRDGENGLLFDTFEEGERHLRALLHDAATRQSLAGRAAQEAHTRFSPERFFSDLMSVYASRRKMIRAQAHPLIDEIAPHSAPLE